jgi:hypothetical protein
MFQRPGQIQPTGQRCRHRCSAREYEGPGVLRHPAMDKKDVDIIAGAPTSARQR